MKLQKFERLDDWIRIIVEVNPYERAVLDAIIGDPCRNPLNLPTLFQRLTLPIVFEISMSPSYTRRYDSGCYGVLTSRSYEWNVYMPSCKKRGIDDEGACAEVIIMLINDFLEFAYKHMPLSS